MPIHKNFRAWLILLALLILATVVLLREHRASFLRPGVHLNAYVSTDDGNVTVIDLAALRPTQKIYVAPGIADLREPAHRDEIWGVNSAQGFVFVIDAPSNQVVSRIYVGPLPYSLDFSTDGRHAFTTSAAANQILAIDTNSRAIIARRST